MKIAIQGHPTRGKEVIQILKNLGGINRMHHSGRYKNYFYYISGDDNTITWTCIRPKHFNVYILEEFEKDFPFKIGDKVKYITAIAIIKGYCYINNEPAYKVESMELGIVATIPTKLFEPYKEMEIRNITLTLEKAKEWYKKGGEPKEVALQAYSEEELNPLPRSWEEFVESTKFTFNGNLEFINEFGQWSNGCLSNKSIGESSKIWNKYVALFQLEQLRDCWRQGWIPNCYDDQQTKYCVGCHRGKFKISVLNETSRFLSFPTYEMAEEFLKCFRDLIEKAEDLI